MQAITRENISEFLASLSDTRAIDLAEFIRGRPEEERFIIFESLALDRAIDVFEYLPFPYQIEILNRLPSEKIAKILNEISPDDRTSLLEELPKDIVNQLLKYLSPDQRAISIKLLGYPEESIGRLMTPDFIAIKLDWTVKQVLDVIREKGHDSETISWIYAVDDSGRLLDDFRIKQFLFAPLDAKVESFSDRQFIALNVNDDEEKAIPIFRKYDRVALPVIDNKGIMLGIVTVDDIIDVAVEEDTEDIQKYGGLHALKAPYLTLPFFTMLRKRLGWLTILFLGEMLTATAMAFFQDEIAKAVVLALFIPLIISSGGNAGSQASTLIVRALALGEVKLKDWFKVMWREILSGLCLGIILGLIGFFRVFVWGQVFNTYGPDFALVAFTVFFALVGVILWGTLSGSMFPLLLKRIGFDPAIASAPFVATMVDVVGLVIYFSFALLFLGNTLL